MTCYVSQITTPKISEEDCFFQLMKEPTRTTSRTVIDHVITNRTDLVSSSGIIYCGISDHDVVFMQKKMRMPKLRLPPKTISVKNFKHFDRNEYLII